jgi:hypothetical protein
VLPEPGSLDLEQLFALIREDGTVSHIKFANWCGYQRPTWFRQLIERRADEIEKAHGSVLYGTTLIKGGKGNRQQVREYYLNHAQLNHLLIVSGLPQLQALRGLIATVFTSWQGGKFRPTDTDTEVKVQEATDRVIDSTPGIMQLGFELARREDALRAAQYAQQARDAAMRTESTIKKVEQTKHKGPTAEADRCSRYIIWNSYQGHCPCGCGVQIMKSLDEFVKDGRQRIAAWDHWHQHHKRGPEYGWYLFSDCNQQFEKDRNYRDEKKDRWIAYQVHVKDYFKKIKSDPLFI